jgi:hypothetical protein
MVKFKIPKEIEDGIRAHWRHKCLQYCRDHDLATMYMILKAAVRGPRDQAQPDNPDVIFPRFGNACRINAQGVVTAQYQINPQTAPVEVNVGTAIQVRDAMRRMADRLKLIDADRVALFTLFANYIEKDERATSET